MIIIVPYVLYVATAAFAFALGGTVLYGRKRRRLPIGASAMVGTEAIAQHRRSALILALLSTALLVVVPLCIEPFLLKHVSRTILLPHVGLVVSFTALAWVLYGMLTGLRSRVAHRWLGWLSFACGVSVIATGVWMHVAIFGW